MRAIHLNGAQRHFNSPADAIHAGIGMIHGTLHAGARAHGRQNVALGLSSSRGPLLDLDRVSKRIDGCGQRYSLKVQPDAQVWQLSVGEQQRVEILKALYRGAALLALDKPTAMLTPQEVGELFKVLRQMAADGHALIFISHKLHEIIDVSQRVTVMRDGRVVSTHPTAGSRPGPSSPARWSAARWPLKYEKKPYAASAPDVTPRLAVDDLWVRGDRGRDALRGVSLQVHAGEILGIARGVGQRPARIGRGPQHRFAAGDKRSRAGEWAGVSDPCLAASASRPASRRSLKSG